MVSKPALIVAGLVALTCVAYWPTLAAPWLYEDAHLPAASAPWSSIPLFGRGLTTWSLLATSGDPGLAHGLNVALHLACGVLVAVVAYYLAGPVAMPVAAAAHLWNPLTSQAVWYVTGRGDLLMTLGVLVALAAALSSAGRWRWIVMAGGILLAIGSKEVGVVVVPLVLLTLVRWRPADLRVPVAAAVFWIGTGALMGLAWRPMVGWATMRVGWGGPDVAWTEFVVRQLGLVWSLCLTLLVLTGFSIDHDALSLSWPWLMGSLVATAAVIAGMVWAWRRSVVDGWALAFVVLALVPRLIVPTNEFVSERHLYLPMVGVSVLLGHRIAVWLGHPWRWPIASTGHSRPLRRGVVYG